MALRHLQVLVGETVPERDISEDVVGLAFSSAAPGGFASCSFTLPGRALLRYVNQLRHDGRVWVRRGAKTLWEGYVVNDPEAVKFGDSADVAVECAGLLEVAKRRRDYAKTWVDKDTDAWFVKQSSSHYEVDTDGRLKIICADDTTVSSGAGYALYYWIDGGMGDDDISHAGFDADYDLGSAFTCSIDYSTSPWGSWSTSDWEKVDLDATVTDQRAPSAGSFAAGTRAVRLRLVANDGTTTSADRFVDVTDIKVFSAAYTSPYLSYYMEDAADDIADSTTDSITSGSAYTGTAAIRPFSNRAEALDYLGSLHSVALEWGFWEDASFTVGARDTTPAVAHHLIVDASDAGTSWDVERIAEDACEAVCVMYAIIDDATYPNGTIRATYRASEPAAADARVHVLDYSSQYMTATEAANAGDQYLEYMSTAQYEGSVIVQGSCKRVDGVTVYASDMRAGMWVENMDEWDHAPRYVSHCDYDDESETATLTIGDPRREFAISTPIPRRYVAPNIIRKKF